LGYLKVYTHKYGIGFCIAVFFVILEAFCDLMQPMIMSKIVDTGVANKDLNYVIQMGVIMLIIAGFGAIFASIRNVMASNVSQKLGTELRSDLFKKI